MNERLMSFRVWLCLLLIAGLCLGLTGCGVKSIGSPESEQKILPSPTPFIDEFNGQRALRDVEYQVALGPRIPGSTAHEQVVAWMSDELEKSGWQAEVQETIFKEHQVRNVIGKYGNGRPWVILGAHYDSRIVADQDPFPEHRATPVPGANDGASGVSVLLELARVIPGHIDEQDGQIWLVFFDVEDNGGLPGWEWILGSQAFVAELEAYPDKAVIVDMIGDAELSIYKEINSTPEIIDEIWAQAADLGYEQYFIPEYKRRILDDHVPFLQAGIPAADLIDFDYPSWHTLEDTVDKVSAQSLQIVGETVLAWLKAQKQNP